MNNNLGTSGDAGRVGGNGVFGDADGGLNQSGEVERPGEICRQFFGDAFGTMEYFAKMLEDEGEIRGLIGPRELPRLWTRHIVNSGQVAAYLPEGEFRLADVGSGAGFPGIVLAIMRPDVQVTLIEPMERRCEWLDECVTEMGLENVAIFNGRAEEALQPKGARKFHVVTARAVAHTKKLAPMVAPLLYIGGKMLALKGRRVDDEVIEARQILKKCRFSHVRIRKVPSPIVPNDPEETTRILEAVRR
ncbi:MAG: 16S rRNA (guanine(527)-N(7))-methyltransferase RsmG [Actinomycetaceae bacterium]|nr:16S rRNA (guanine(527)-N(7))-methyltransferase RsmG [Actinomycetaceae bacterium]